MWIEIGVLTNFNAFNIAKSNKRPKISRLKRTWARFPSDNDPSKRVAAIQHMLLRFHRPFYTSIQ